MAAVVPTCLALVLCDAVTLDPVRRRSTIVGAFQLIVIDSLPATTQPFSVWMQLSGGHGALPMALIVERIASDTLEAERILQVRFTLDFKDPNVVLEHQSVFMDGIRLDAEGHYGLRLTAAGSTIMRRSFAVLLGL